MKEEKNELNGHAYVDLGLSVRWATCNVGASSPEDYGDYFAWGETSPKSSYDKDNSKTYGKSSYNHDIGGDSSTDAARANWGGSWRLPTDEEFEELEDNCEWIWTTLNGNEGYEVVSRKNGNSIFLPAAGYRIGSVLIYAGEGGDYWSSTPGEYGSSSANYLNFYSSDHYVGDCDRISGFTVRPVSRPVSSATGTIRGHGYVDLGLSVKWATCNVGAGSPEDYGDYFAWAETSPKSSYDEDNSKTPYNSSYYNYDIGGDRSTDAARANWGGRWRMPTYDEMTELIFNCNWTWTTINGKRGYKVVSRKNGNSIFLPAAGERYGKSLYHAGEYGRYWSSTPEGFCTDRVHGLLFDSSNRSVYYSFFGSEGFTVRPVSTTTNSSSTSKWIIYGVLCLVSLYLFVKYVIITIINKVRNKIKQKELTENKD